MTGVAATIERVLLAIAQQRRPELTRIEPEQSITEDLGLDSLEVAQLVATLELELGFDPFATRAFTGVRTVADFITVYTGPS